MLFRSPEAALERAQRDWGHHLVFWTRPRPLLGTGEVVRDCEGGSVEALVPLSLVPNLERPSAFEGVKQILRRNLVSIIQNRTSRGIFRRRHNIGR